ncbi:MAG: 3-oxoacyl-ACP synthase [Elusimicrobia bacterium]|nr:3-oxoacyl-ACP synthase [Elusimicrobiota bacterium]
MHVVVTGIGLMSPIGLGREETWKRLLAGESGIRPAAEGLEARVPTFSENGARSRAGDLAVMAAYEAFDHAGWTADGEIGCAIGQSKPLFGSVELLISSFTGWSLDAVVRDHLDLSGPAAAVAAACATGVAAIETAAGWIRSGRCERALAGAAEANLIPFYRAGFMQMGVLAEGDSPAAARPFDRKRSGFVMGEGAAVLALESEESCRRRGGRVIARLGSVTLRQSLGDPIRQNDSGSDVARLVRAATAGRPPSYINAHGTGTRLNDLVEANGLYSALGDDVTNVLVGSTKASTGHLLGAAGAVEAAFCALAVRDQIAPPSLNLDEPDPACRFQLATAARRVAIDSALSLSYGFGGQMGAVLFERS